ncbi:hypothetical protein SI65_09322 [Aspergillus cristatus]|uniref:Uncharacterized protein n=1 Tax=Aspergillus cristatus TaxID=573508 RepID=A0A1E3B3I3_ASPCR|nr:hypothetical protein SI65_09322 [Aspergillus cristatus]
MARRASVSIGVGILEDDGGYHSTIDLGGLQVSTNYGRTATFAPGVVGQWTNELDDGFELFPDEKVKLQPYTLRRRVLAVTFRSPDIHSLAPRKLQHQYQSCSDKELIAISWILNVSSDRVRAVVSENGNRRAQILVPEQEPPFDQVQKLYFETHKDDGCNETIVTAEAYFRHRAIIGLVFIYTSGKRLSVGDLDVDAARQTVHFPLDAWIVGLSVAVTEEREPLEIEFEVERNEQPRYQKLRLPINSPNGPADTVGYDWRDVWCKHETSAESYERLLARGRVYRLPSESRLVGIYVGCQRLSRFGALYEPKFLKMYEEDSQVIQEGFV